MVSFIVLKDYLTTLAYKWNPTSLFLVVVLPWTLLLVYAGYYYFFKRPAKASEDTLLPVVAFFTALTDGATPGFDKRLMSMFHPALVKEGGVERGLLRAMARCLHDEYGKLTSIPADTVAIKRDGLQVNCVVLAHFEKARGVKCRLTWVQRLPVQAEAKDQEKSVTGTDSVAAIDPRRFHVTSFYVAPRHEDTPLDVIKYLKVNEFEPFAEAFVERLMCKPPVAAVRMMLPALAKKYGGEGNAKQLEDAVQKVVRACGGVGRPEEVECTLMESKLLTAKRLPPGLEDDGEKATGDGHKKEAALTTSIDGIEMTYQVTGERRNMEVYLLIVFAGLRCNIARYELRVQPDPRTQVVLDQDTGESTIVN